MSNEAKRADWLDDPENLETTRRASEIVIDGVIHKNRRGSLGTHVWDQKKAAHKLRKIANELEEDDGLFGGLAHEIQDLRNASHREECTSSITALRATLAAILNWEEQDIAKTCKEVWDAQ